MTPHLLLTMPILFPLAGVALCALLWGRPNAQRYVSLAASAGLFGSSLALLWATFDGTVLATQFGSWAPPFGISFVADMLAAAMVVITGLMAVAVGIYGLAHEASQREQALYHPLYQGLLLGVTGAFLTGDIFNLYVWFEIMLISSFGLLASGGKKVQLDAGVKYVTLNLVSQIGYMLFGIAIATPLALAGSILYVIHHIVVKANLFLIISTEHTGCECCKP